MAERLESWAPRMTQALRDYPERMREAHRHEVDLAAQLMRRRAPRRTGTLQRSIEAKHLDGKRSVVRYPSRYAALDQGGTIRPRGRWLAVPVRRSVVAPTPRQDGRLFSVRRSDGRVFLMRGRGRAAEARWRLVSSVRIRGTRFATSSMAQAREDITRTLEQMGREALA